MVSNIIGSLFFILNSLFFNQLFAVQGDNTQEKQKAFISIIEKSKSLSDTCKKASLFSFTKTFESGEYCDDKYTAAAATMICQSFKDFDNSVCHKKAEIALKDVIAEKVWNSKEMPKEIQAAICDNFFYKASDEATKTRLKAICKDKRTTLTQAEQEEQENEKKFKAICIPLQEITKLSSKDLLQQVFSMAWLDKDLIYGKDPYRSDYANYCNIFTYGNYGFTALLMTAHYEVKFDFAEVKSYEFKNGSCTLSDNKKNIIKLTPYPKQQFAVKKDFYYPNNKRGTLNCLSTLK